MIDYFALLGVSRRPWLDSDEVKGRFLALSADAHPDRAPGQNPGEKDRATARFMEINRAYQCLRDPTSRARHLWELEAGEKPRDVQDVPPDLAGLFEKVFTLLTQTGTFLEEARARQSAVGKAMQFRASMDLVGELETIRAEIQALQKKLAGELDSMNDPWLHAPANPGQRREMLPLRRLEEIYGALSYLGRWEQKINEKIAQLTF